MISRIESTSKRARNDVTTSDLVTDSWMQIDMTKAVNGYAATITVTDDTPAADTFTDTDVDTDEDTITLTAHDLTTGLVGQLTSTGTLPAGLSTATDYYVIVVDANTIQLAESYDNAVAGTAIDITDAGTAAATNTFTATALAGTLKTQWSVDESTWVDIDTEAFTDTETDSWSQTTSPYPYLRIGVDHTAGRYSWSASVAIKSHR